LIYVLKAPVDEISPHRLDIRIGQILEVAKHPDADALYVEKIDVGKLRVEIVINHSVSVSKLLCTFTLLSFFK
jgi:tRNA-binding EMAP/Myf-like protein